MRQITTAEMTEIVAFADKAAAKFAADQRITTVSNYGAGDLIAFRWGLMDDGIVVARLCRDFDPINLGRMISAAETAGEIPQ